MILEDIVRVENCRLMEHGLLAGLRPGLSMLCLDPSMTIDPGDLAGFLAALEEVLTDE